MIQNLGNNIKNMVSCVAGEHCLFRSFGMGGIVDSSTRLTRNSVQVEINRWYPGVVVQGVKQLKAGANGEFEFRIDVRGVENG